MTRRKIAEYAVRVALLIAGILVIRRQLAKRAEHIAVTEQEEAAFPESVQAAAVYQLRRERRLAAESMRADLRKLVIAESLFTADSGHPSAYLPPPYWPQASRGNQFNAIRITPHGWHASIGHLDASIMCAVAVGPDTVLDGAPSGEPVCRNTPRQFDF